MIQIIDYGMGNLRSVQKALEKLGRQAEICTDPRRIAGAERVILPGVGAFRDAITQLRSHGFIDPIRDFLDTGRPFLGICLGLQLLFDVGYEDGEYEGLGLVPGSVVRFDSAPGLKIPHMGWNALQIERRTPLLEGIPEGAYVYFVHSYHVVPEDDSVVATRTDHGGPFVSMIAQGNLYATQFHPEKSQSVGLKLLENFAKLPINA
ncbi:MAG: imidazole glycerol phosphate synthase subunit HisH [Planctomycetota bacterium]|nr:MAG: imidazole glycerol phosphate synthase subunit HisH [Planctomycetota bacterium]REJ95199.1 MAG: imidazole glycerol phosphate synthase subunit HisH [Planctomycetota bacterium]REK25044.1 MAG: imidazole glycerol phosphate synthase subunit HisH [Planctomycetota bacterium]REK28109.1 MAG: imidazole glycerol phosphate synthase subunit HisH [Planctomycetota bacterium]